MMDRPGAPAELVALQINWKFRRFAVILSPILVRDLLLDRTVPCSGELAQFRIFGCEAARFRVVRRLPTSGNVVVVANTRIIIVPALPRSLRSLCGNVPKYWQSVLETVRSAAQTNCTLKDLGLMQPRIILLVGPHGVGKTTATAMAAAQIGLELLRFSAADVLRSSVTREGYWAPLKHFLDCAIAIAPALLLLEDIQFLFPHSEHQGRDPEDPSQVLEALAHRVASVDSNVVVVLTAAPSLQAVPSSVLRTVDFVLELNHLPTHDDASHIYQAELKAKGWNTICPQVISRLAKLAVGSTVSEIICSLRALESKPIRDIENLEQQVQHELHRLTTIRNSAENGFAVAHIMHHTSQRGVLHHGPNQRAFNAVGADEAVQALREALTWDSKRQIIQQNLGVKLLRGILLYGPPGTGKTLVVREVAAELEVSILAIDAATLARGESGVSEQILRSVYAKAIAAAPCIVFFDEIDALFPSTKYVSGKERKSMHFGHGTASLGRVAQALTQILDFVYECVEKTVVTVAATNRPWKVPSALLRVGRIECCIHVGLPNAEARAQLAELYGLRIGMNAAELEMLKDWISSDEAAGMSGADIGGAYRRAVLRANGLSNELVAFGGITISSMDIVLALKESGRSVGKLCVEEIQAWRWYGARH